MWRPHDIMRGLHDGPLMMEKRTLSLSVFSNEADKMSKGVFTNPLPGLQYTCEDLP